MCLFIFILDNQKGLAKITINEPGFIKGNIDITITLKLS